MKDKKVVIDLTNDEDINSGIPIDTMKNIHSLYFTYDPRGIKKDLLLPIGYCRGCHCPSNYCSGIILGSMCCDHAFEILNTGGGSWSVFDSEDYRGSFKEAYTIAIESKSRWNSIKKD